jgi:rod shape determining protein RodA
MKSLRKVNIFLVLFPFLLFLLGFITLVSTSPGLAKKQLLYFVLGIFVYFIATAIDYRVFQYIWKYLYFVVLFLLILTYFVGRETFGSSRWLTFIGINIQASEYAKAVFILSLPVFLTSKKFMQTKVKKILIILGFCAFMLGMVFMQPDLGSTLILIAIVVGLLLYGGLELYYFLFGFIILGILSRPAWTFLHDYQKRRILVFLNPSLDVLGAGYNVVQSMIAVGSGKVWGRGFGRGTQSHLQFLPVYWTDFIFAAFAEEWGFVGVVTMLLFYVVLLFTLLKVASRASDLNGKLIAIGVFILFFSQFLINVGMNLGVMPVTGIPLPLVSFGGNSLLVSMFLLGVVQSVWIHRKA